MVEITSTISNLLIIAGIGVGVRLITSRFRQIPYTIVLVVAGLIVSLFEFRIGIPITHDIIFFIILPPILFSGILRLDYDHLLQNIPLILILLLVGLPVAILLMGFLGQYVMAVPLIVSLLLASMVYPLDPVAILSVFQAMDAPDRLLTVIQGEPVFDDGLAVVFFTTFLVLYQSMLQSNISFAKIITLSRLGSILSEFIVVIGGGLLVGIMLGAIVSGISRFLATDELTDLLLSILVAYGGMLIGEHYLHFSGILAVVAGGLVMGYVGVYDRLTSEGREFIYSSWDEAELLASTGIYILIGTQTRIPQLIDQADLILFWTVLFLGVRALIVYGLIPVGNRWMAEPLPGNYRPVLVGGALHTVVPIALALSLPASLPVSGQLQTIVFGVAIVSIIVQGLSIPYVLRWTDIA